MLRRRTQTLIALLSAFAANLAIAAAGDIDTSFGDDGNAAISHVALGTFFPSTPIVQPDGKVLVCGFEFDAVTFLESSYIYRFSAEGSPDTAFGDAGRAFVADDVSACENVVLQGDGKIVVTGSVEVAGDADDRQTAVLRLDSGGTPDAGFGVDGVVDVNLLAGEWDNAERVAIAPDGSIVLGVPLDPSAFGIVRLREDGSLDGTFGDAGRAEITFADATDRDLRALLFDSSGRLTVIGSFKSLIGARTRAVVAVRLLADGVLDGSFGDDGLATFSLPGDASARDAVRDTDGAVLLAGILESGGETRVALIRMTDDGRLDASFADDGSRVLPIHGVNDTVFDMLPRGDGSWLLCGFTEASNHVREALVLALDQNGDPIESFGDDGVRTYPAAAGNAYFLGLAAQRNDVIAYAMSTDRASGEQTFFVTRLEGGGSRSPRGHSHHRRAPHLSF